MAKKTGKLAVGGFLLAALGYLAGILTAPKSGKETRKDIQDKAIKAKYEAEKSLKNVHNELGHLIDSAKSTAQNLGGKAKAEVDKAVDKAQATKDRVRIVLSALHEGGAEDKELKKAIDDANKAVAHLKSYVGNVKKDVKAKAK